MNKNIENLKPLISVITVVYNAEKLLEKTLVSIFNQTYINQIEIVVIDGKSNDGTLDIIDRYRSKINCFISEQDTGIYDAMNKGIKVAKGDYILFLNAGDVFYDKKTLYNISFNLKDNDVIYGNTAILDKCGVLEIRNFYKIKEDWKTIPYCHQSVFIRRELLLSNLFDLKFKIAADYNQYHSLKKIKAVFKSVDQIISIYDFTGFSSINYKATLLEVMKISLLNNSNILVKLKIRLYFYLRVKFSRY